MRALYDLGRYLPSFNIAEWIVQAEALGATKVIFDVREMRHDKWPSPFNWRRFESICLPMPALIGLAHEVFDRGTTAPTEAQDIAKPGGASLVQFWNSGKRFKRLRTVRPHVKCRYTVTLRKTQRSPGRNSDESVWREFAKEIGAWVIPDYDDAPTHLHERMALYAGAEMNFFVSNGPGVLCSLSEYPMMMFCAHHAWGSYKGDGMGEWGAQYPWALPQHRSIWEDATRESLRRHFRHWKDTGGWLDCPPKPAAP